MLMARARAGPGKVSRSSDIAAGLSAAAPAPWMMRPATSIAGLAAAAASRVPAVNRADPATNMRRRPNRSAARPDSSSRPPNVEHVGVDDPGDAGRAEPEVGLDGGQCHVDDRGVEHDHELRGDQQTEGDRAAAATEEAGQRTHGCGVGWGGGAGRRFAVVGICVVVIVACLVAVGGVGVGDAVVGSSASATRTVG